MNKKYIVFTPHKTVVYCVLSADENWERQMEAVLGIRQGAGFSVRLQGRKIELVDYFHGEVAAEFRILAIEDTDEAVCLAWKPYEEK